MHFYKYFIFGLISLGIILRLSIFLVSPANNSYDDHLEVIKCYADDFERPAPFQCWECYQPPLYYAVGSSILNSAKYLGGGPEFCWKLVQLINPILSVLTLLVCYKILLFLKIPPLLTCLTLSFLIVLPRDIFTSVMIGNDYMLVFFAVLSFLLFIMSVDALKCGSAYLRYFAVLSVASTLGSLTKQHGLLLHLFPIVFVLLVYRESDWVNLFRAIPLLLIGVSISFIEEAWKYSETGEWFVSNQHFFDYAKNQYPGSLDKVEFFSFRIKELYQYPFLSEDTSASFFTELFARTLYDYEWRFISPRIPWAKSLGYISYSMGLIWILVYFVAFLVWLKKSFNNYFLFNWNLILIKGTPVFLAMLFLLVPLLQTLRYPYFSSMKSMFMLSGLIFLFLSLGSILKIFTPYKIIVNLVVLLNVVYGITLVVSIAVYFGISINHLHGPLWSMPLF